MSEKRPAQRSGRRHRGRDDRGFRADARSVSYVVGYAIVLGVVVMGGIGAFVIGVEMFAGVVESGEIAQADDNAERLNDDVRTVAGNAPRRVTTLEMHDARLAYAATEPRIEIEVVGNGDLIDGSSNVVLNPETEPVVYRLNDPEVRYYSEFGLLARNQSEAAGGGDPVLRAEPQFRITEERITLVVPDTAKATDSMESVGISGAGSTEETVSLKRTDSTLIQRSDSSDLFGVRVTVENSNVPEAWRTFFEDHPGLTLDASSTDVGSGTVVAETDKTATHLTVRYGEVAVAFGETR